MQVLKKIKSSRDINNTWLRLIKDQKTQENIYKNDNPLKEDVPK